VHKLSKILVTGGAGFIGSHVVDKLVQRGFKVRVLDNLSTGSIENIKHHVEAGRVELIVGDVRNVNEVAKAVEGVDAVIHEAALTSVPRSIEDPAATHDVNVTGTLNLLRACLNAGVKRFIYASSSSIYGETETLPKKEDMPAKPISPYAASKLAAESYCLAFHKAYGLEAVALRYFNVYGPRQTYGPYSGVITIFINRLLAGEPPIIYGDGTQTRDFTYVDDAAEATVTALESSVAVGNAINIATGRQTSVNQLAKTLIGIVGRNTIKPVYAPPRKGDIKHSYADISKAVKLLNYKPKFSLEDGLKLTVEWFRRRRPIKGRA